MVTDDGTDPDRAAALAASADLAVVVVGYTRLDEGEYIGEFATAHLAHLFPGDDDPALVERFTAQIADERSIEPPAHAAPSAAAGGFAEGGDRRSLHLHDQDVALIRAVAAANPRTVVAMVAGSAVVISEWDTDRSRPSCRRGTRGWRGAMAWPTCCSGPSTPPGRLPFSVPDAGVRSSRLRRRRRRFHLRRLARLLVPGPERGPSRLPVRLRAELHHLRPRVGRSRGGRRRHPGPRHG